MKKTRLNKKGKSSVSQLRRKCDALLQEEGKRRYKNCEVCGNPISCLHHFFPKSTSSRLRYDWLNLIPICQGCHMRHHQAGDPSIHGTIIKKRGMEWYEDMKVIRHEIIKVNVAYYEEILKELENE